MMSSNGSRPRAHGEEAPSGGVDLRRLAGCEGEIVVGSREKGKRYGLDGRTTMGLSASAPGRYAAPRGEGGRPHGYAGPPEVREPSRGDADSSLRRARDVRVSAGPPTVRPPPDGALRDGDSLRLHPAVAVRLRMRTPPVLFVRRLFRRRRRLGEVGYPDVCRSPHRGLQV